jgi:ANTAR domain/GAF domain
MTHPSSSDGPAPDRAFPRLAVAGDEPRGGRTPGSVSTLDVVRFAREVWGTEDPRERLRRGVGLAVDLVDGCDHAAVSVTSRGRLHVGPASDAVARQADQLQHELNEGPCLDAVHARGNVTTQDLGREPRWRQWCPRVVERLGVRAAKSLLLADDKRMYGLLTLYSDQAEAWSDGAADLAEVLATNLTLAFADGLQLEHRSRAMVTRTVIGQAQGILMERFDLDQDAAYALLLRFSQQEHLKLGEVAAELVRTTQLPGSGGGRTPPATS